MKDNDDPVRDRAPWNVLCIAIVLAVLMTFWVFGRWITGSGWPGSLGFTPKEWPSFWVGMWTSGLPTIAITASIGIGAGLYLSNRDRNRVERERRQRYEDDMDVVGSRAARLTRRGFHVQYVDRLEEAMPEPAPIIYDLIKNSPLGAWRAHTSGYNDLINALDQFRERYEDFQDTVAEFNRTIDGRTRRQVLALQRRLSSPAGGKLPIGNAQHIAIKHGLVPDEKRYKQYVVEILQRESGSDRDLIRMLLAMPVAEIALYDLMWRSIRNTNEVSNAAGKYKLAHKRLINATYALKNHVPKKAQ